MKPERTVTVQKTLDEVFAYLSDFTFKGVTRFIAPLMKPAFTRLGNDAESGMAAALARL